MDHPLWKYCSKEEMNQMLLSLELLDRTVWPDDKHLACLYALSNHPERNYRSIQIPKKDQTLRTLYEPMPLLKQIQRNMLHHVLRGLSVSEYATAYKQGAGIRSNSEPHLQKPVILKVDIENYFDNITFPMVYRHAFPGIYFPAPIRTLLTNLCCYRECLPQGAPTSAYISNLVLKPFDEYIGQWCKERDIAYTRYCDDITCSGSFQAESVRRKLAGFLQELGFHLNNHKTHVITNGQRQTVTGVTVNDKLQVPRDYRESLRKELYYCRKHGPAAHLQFIQDQRYLPLGTAGVSKYLQSLSGRVNYVLDINPDDGYFREAAVVLQDMRRELEESDRS